VLARLIPGYDPSLFDSRGAEVRIEIMTLVENLVVSPDKS
jgi:hypothetical protein